MTAEVAYVSVKHPSADGTTQLNAAFWMPADKDVAPRAIIQITHGMAEYIDRYDAFARYLVGRGFVVCGQDMIGHGQSANTLDDLGHIPLSAGKEALLADMHSLRLLAQDQFPGVPFVLYGHSMGSFMVRCYLARYGEGVAAAILSGTGNLAPALSHVGGVLARREARKNGERHKSAFIDGMGAGGYGKKIKGARTDLDWLSTDAREVDAYIDDPLCGVMFSVGGYAALLDLTEECAKPACPAAWPADMPVLFVAGDADPVGDCGRGVQAAAESVQKARKANAQAAPVQVRLYEGARHEIHNEPIRDQVYNDIATWIDQQFSR